MKAKSMLIGAVMATLLQLTSEVSVHACDAFCKGQNIGKQLCAKAVGNVSNMETAEAGRFTESCTASCQQFVPNDPNERCYQGCEVIREFCQPKPVAGPRRAKPSNSPSRQAPQPDSEKISCGRLWFERNRLFHQYGYCFQTAIGKKTFGNAGCRHRSSSAAIAAMNSDDRADLENIEKEERGSGCK